MINQDYVRLRETETWSVLERAISDLMDNDDILLRTDKDLVIGYLCKALADRPKEGSKQ
jgi:hypothetical protein